MLFHNILSAQRHTVLFGSLPCSVLPCAGVVAVIRGVSAFSICRRIVLFRLSRPFFLSDRLSPVMALFNLPDGSASSIGSSKRTPPAGRFHLIGGILDAPALLGTALGFLLVVVCFPDAARFLWDKIPVQGFGLVHSWFYSYINHPSPL